MTGAALRAVKWVVGPLVVAALAARLGQLRGEAARAGYFGGASAPAPADDDALRAAPLRAAGNATWALGSADSVKEIAKWELDRLAEADVDRRVQLLLRFGIVDTNPDGQAAIFGQVCVADPKVCDHLKDAAERETRTRLVSPGNHLPLFFLAGHPHVPSL